MRSLEEATELYMKLRRDMSDEKKSEMSVFEGQKFFRDGNSWVRNSHDQEKYIVLPDEKDELQINSRSTENFYCEFTEKLLWGK